jgi:hypothetical protein
LELLYARPATVSGRAYDQETIRDYDRLTEHITKTQLGRSYKYGLIVRNKQRLENQERMRTMKAQEAERMRRKEEQQKAEEMLQTLPMGATAIPSDVSATASEATANERQQSLQESNATANESYATAIPMGGKGHTLISQDVNQAAQRLNLLCGSVAAGNDNPQLKNEISMICDHIYAQKVLKKPELKKIVKRYCM